MAVREAQPLGSLHEVREAGLDREDLLGIYRNLLVTRGIAVNETRMNFRCIRQLPRRSPRSSTTDGNRLEDVRRLTSARPRSLVETRRQE